MTSPKDARRMLRGQGLCGFVDGEAPTATACILPIGHDDDIHEGNIPPWLAGGSPKSHGVTISREVPGGQDNLCVAVPTPARYGEPARDALQNAVRIAMLLNDDDKRRRRSPLPCVRCGSKYHLRADPFGQLECVDYVACKERQRAREEATVENAAKLLTKISPGPWVLDERQNPDSNAHFGMLCRHLTQDEKTADKRISDESYYAHGGEPPVDDDGEPLACMISNDCASLDDLRFIALARTLMPKLLEERESLLATKNAVYTERDKCVALIAAMAKALGYVVGRGEHPADDTTWDVEWRNIVYIDLPTGQVSFHIHDRELPWFEGLASYGASWDGHTTEEKYARVLEAAKGLRARTIPPPLPEVVEVLQPSEAESVPSGEDPKPVEPSGKNHCGDGEKCRVDCYSQDRCECFCDRCGPWNNYRDDLTSWEGREALRQDRDALRVRIENPGGMRHGEVGDLLSLAKDHAYVRFPGDDTVVWLSRGCLRPAGRP
jgi:hypothetical protein